VLGAFSRLRSTWRGRQSVSNRTGGVPMGLRPQDIGGWGFPAFRRGPAFALAWGVRRGLFPGTVT